jgi:TRAP transporter TAXI family solute receptor
MREAGVLSLATCLIVLASACAPDPEVPAPPVLRFSTGQPGGGFYPFGLALGKALGKRDGPLQIAITSSAGAVANVNALQRNNADIGFVFADVAYLAYEGRLDGTSVPFDQLRAVAVLQLTPVQFVARADGAIRSIADLRGRRVSVGPEGSGTALTTRLIFEAFGLDPDSVRTEFLPFSEAGVWLREGRLDAMFDNAIYAEAAAEALNTGARLVSIKGSPVDQLRREYPFLRLTVVPRDTYPGVDAVQTVGVDSVLICRRDLPEDVVHALTERLFEVMPTLEPWLRRNLAQLTEAAATPIPLHEGAARYYREQQLIR